MLIAPLIWTSFFLGISSMRHTRFDISRLTAFCGCLQFGDMKGIQFIPIFLEMFAKTAEEFEQNSGQWRPDRSRSDFEEWSGYRDVLDRIAGCDPAFASCSHCLRD